jgi:hypothetical protein
MGNIVVFIFKSRLLSLYTAQWCGFLRAIMEVTLVGLLMITRKENLYHLMILSYILTRLRNQSCKSSIVPWLIWLSLMSMHVSHYICFGLMEMIWSSIV